MIVLCVANCPPGLRGDLSKWLSEVNTGVYVGRLSARVREELWERVCTNIKSGQATMVYSTNNEQGYAFLGHNTTWVPIDYEGITLMRRPLTLNEDEREESFLQRGFSKAAKYENMKRFKNNKGAADYVILGIGVIDTGVKDDGIIAIGLLGIKGGKIDRECQFLVRSDAVMPEGIFKLSGITVKMEEGLDEETVLDMVQKFIGDALVVGYDVQCCVDFLQGFAKSLGKTVVIKKTRDAMRIAHRKLDDLTNYELETVARYFSLDILEVHDVLTECMLIYKVYLELNKL